MQTFLASGFIMVMTIIPLICHAESSSPVSIAKNTEIGVASDTQDVIKAVMQDQYGKDYDQVHQCWRFSFKSDSGDETFYCMQPRMHKIVTLGNGEQNLYFISASLNNINGDARYLYGHNDSGVLGAFKVKLNGGGKWSYLASNKAIAEGTMGSCGCDDAKFVKMNNNNNYGWIFSSGGTWQGATVLNYGIIVALGNRFEDVSSIPEVTEDKQDIKYLIDIDSSGKLGELYPLIVTETKGGIKKGRYVVKFDPKMRQYKLPN